jgi:hypothetical protein
MAQVLNEQFIRMQTSIMANGRVKRMLSNNVDYLL